MPAVLRILDANANRAREAIRVMEEAARFILNDAPLAEACKSLRHELSQACASVPNLDAFRDTPGDVGTTITITSEQSRAGVAAVAAAAGKRLSEALRSIEEYAKTLPPPTMLAATAEQLRYRGYTLEQHLNEALSTGRAAQWRLCLLLTESLCAQPWRSVLEQAIDAGVDCVQLREKHLDSGELLARAKDVVEVCRGRGVTTIVNDRPDIAFLAGADGVHVGQTDLMPHEIRKLVGRQLLVGMSTTNLDEARRAVAAGVDYVGLGPMFPTTTKHKPVLAGPQYAGLFLTDEQLAATPHLAIGGVQPGNVNELAQVGVRGIAVSSVICGAQDVRGTVQELLRPWRPSAPSHSSADEGG